MAAGSSWWASAATLFFLIVSCNCGIDWSSISTPPRFIHEENDPVVFFKVESNAGDDQDVPVNLLEQTLKCIAEGNPPPEYKWTKNGKPLRIDMFPHKIVQKPGEGTLAFSRLDEGDEGVYQCEARNDNGSAVARASMLKQTWMRSFVPQEPEVVQVELGDPYQRNCTPAGSTPNARVFWILKGIEQGQFDTINGSHISSNEQGTLFFHYVREEDLKPDRLYTCTAENTELKEYKFGPQFKLEITKNRRRSLQPSPPSEQYVNQSSPIALQGNQHKLHCFFSGYPAPKPTWYHNGHEINEDTADGFKFESYGKTLVFNVTMDKAGKYDCRFPMHNDIDRTFNVVVEAAPYWPEGPPPNTNTSEGETVTFDCTTSGKPVPLVTFYKNGVEMKQARDGEKWLIEGNRLTIYDVRKGVHGKGDNAVYQCKAENKHGYVWANFYLNLLAFKPQLLTDAGEVEAVSGQSVTLECKFFASPNAVITWKSVKLQGVAHDEIPANAHGVGKLVIKSVTPEAEGEYECIGTNKYGVANGRAMLMVRKSTRLEPFPHAEEVRVAGEDIRLPCTAIADDKLEVKYEWLVNGVPMQDSQMNSGHYYVENDHSLVVRNPTHYDTAKYKCVASTKLDKVEKEISIQIKDVPAPAHIAYVSKCEAAAQSAEITFEHMEPADTVVPVKEFWVQYQMDSNTEGTQWRTHPVPVQATKDLIEDEQRKIRATATVGLQPYGKYVFRVLARNSVGDSAPTKVKDICETPSKRPDRNPSDVSAKGSGPDNLIVSWTPMPREEWNGENFHYKIKYRPVDSNEPFKEYDFRDPFGNKHTISFEDDKNARPFQPYEVQVQAVNNEGVALVEPQIVEGRTGEGVPSSIPADFRLLTQDGTSATFTWSRVDPETANGNFSGYKITYWHIPTDDDEDETSDDEEKRFRWRRELRFRRESTSRRKSAVFGPDATTGTITDLKPATVNFAVIQVINSANEGPESNEVSFETAEGVPSAVRGLRAHPMNNKNSDEKGVVALIWKKPRQANGKIQKYIVEYCRTQNGIVQERDCPRQEVDNSKNQARVDGLEFETPYRFIVRALTGAGEGDPNSADATTLPEIVAGGVDPGTPSFIENDIGDNFFNVTFKPSEFDETGRGPVGNTFLVEYKESSDGEDAWKEAKQQDEDLTVTVDQLSPGTRYDVRVAAVQQDLSGDERKTYSQISHITTTGRSPATARTWYMLLALLILLLLLIICCICCVAFRHRGQNYPVSEKEREQGREPILGKQHFGEYRNDDEKRSLTGSHAPSETDSMAEYGDTDPGRFTEDGSFIGQYVPQNKLLPAERPEKGSTSTFV